MLSFCCLSTLNPTNSAEEFVSRIKQANSNFFFLSTSLLHLSFPPFFWPQMTCDFPLQSTQPGTVGKTKKMGVDGGRGMEEQGKEGKGALWENNNFAIFPKPTIFPRGWENRERERRGGGDRWERKRDDPCHPLILKLQWDYVLQIHSVNAVSFHFLK